jgi:hypothetical protein
VNELSDAEYVQLPGSKVGVAFELVVVGLANVRPAAKVLASTTLLWAMAALRPADEFVGLVAESELQLAANTRPATIAERENDDGMRMGLRRINWRASSP